MIKLFGVGAALTMMVAPTARAADLLGNVFDAPAPVVLVPYCVQNAPPIGLQCVPRAGVAAPDFRTVRASVDLNRRIVRRPYSQLFSWGP